MQFAHHGAGFGRRNRFDPYFWAVTAHVPQFGANTSTTFPEYGVEPPLTITANGNAQISTAQPYTAQLSGAAFDGTGDYLSATLAATPGTAAYCLEGSIYMTSNADGGFGSLGVAADPGGGGVSVWIVGGSGAFRTRIGKSVAASFVDLLGVGSLSTGTWYDMKTLRLASNTAEMYVNRSLNVSSASSIDLNMASMVFGRAYPNENSSYLTGYGANWRMTQGISRQEMVDFPPFALNG